MLCAACQFVTRICTNLQLRFIVPTTKCLPCSFSGIKFLGLMIWPHPAEHTFTSLISSTERGHGFMAFFSFSALPMAVRQLFDQVHKSVINYLFAKQCANCRFLSINHIWLCIRTLSVNLLNKTTTISVHRVKIAVENSLRHLVCILSELRMRD